MGRESVAEYPDPVGRLDFGSPNLRIFRAQLWDRGQETYGEAPVLTGRMGVAYVTSL